MARFFLKGGTYFETITEVEPGPDGWPDGRIEVPQRPSPDHVWHEGAWVYVAPDPEIAKAAARAGMVVSRFQARAALLSAGLLDAAEAAVAQADAVTKLAWSDAQEFRRNSPTIAALAGIVGLTDEQIDNLFIAAGQIQA